MYRAEVASRYHHVRRAGLHVLHARPEIAGRSLIHRGKLLGHDMGMDIDDHHPLSSFLKALLGEMDSIT
jgi:hypothetical protein